MKLNKVDHYEAGYGDGHPSGHPFLKGVAIIRVRLSVVMNAFEDHSCRLGQRHDVGRSVGQILLAGKGKRRRVLAAKECCDNLYAVRVLQAWAGTATLIVSELS